jgi:transcriptional regulator with XRE-family HTH domain
MTHRAEFDGSHQKRALRSLLVWQDRALRTRSGKTLKDLAEELAISPATLARYLNGTTPLGSDQFAAFARAFETTEAELIARCFPGTMLTSMPADPEADPDWDFRATLAALIPDHPRYVAHLAEEYEDELIAVQKAVAEFLADLIQAGAFRVPPGFENGANGSQPRSQHIAEREAYAM